MLSGWSEGNPPHDPGNDCLVSYVLAHDDATTPAPAAAAAAAAVAAAASSSAAPPPAASLLHAETARPMAVERRTRRLFAPVNAISPSSL